jgi:hypothetical protein
VISTQSVADRAENFAETCGFSRSGSPYPRQPLVENFPFAVAVVATKPPNQKTNPDGFTWQWQISNLPFLSAVIAEL